MTFHSALSLRGARTFSSGMIAFIAVFSCIASVILDCLPAVAKAGRFAFELPVYGQVAHQNLATQVRPFVTQQVDRQFRQDPNLEVVEIFITVNRNGDVMPLLTTAVSRSQWQQSPQISLWTRYHGSYADFQRPTRSFRRSVIATQRRNVNSWQGVASRLEISLDRGKLSKRLAQQKLSDLD
ncbi:hypothetical protein IQ266_03950 [filamentous cyanobacterium LEGE 11480]|uniref:Uncharacterized protein n=1 Tax=Romeriopsis navalis LEGE 11480 TaxID=2777977 RepID=A0A928VN52_9CYAN|nr:hypothetical protein [Romeriopsis navalis]MBE9028914.1 hypothetical protein [Romeriopsis navalis LEGE 11480]